MAMHILSSNGMKSVIVDLIPRYRSMTGTEISITWGSAVGLVQELERGTRADLVILTDEMVDDLIARAKVVAGTRVDLARSGIGIAVRAGTSKPDIGSAESLKATLLAARSVAHSKSGMSGIYFPTVLTRLGIADAMKSRIVIPEPGTPVGEVVARGDAELGVQQISELLPVAGIEIVGPLPPPLQKITTFAAGTLVDAEDHGAVTALVKFLAAESRPLLAQRGLEPASG
jgi:molybdate transport system substrate-binding protein